MIQAQDLRIGNKIMSDGCVVTVAGIGEYMTVTTKQGNKITAHYDLSRPIPLSPELLEKCGFKLVPSGIENIVNPYYAKNCVLLFFNETQTDFFLMSYGFSFGCRAYAATTRWVKYLHEVQNYYHANVGTELSVQIPEQ